MVNCSREELSVSNIVDNVFEISYFLFFLMREDNVGLEDECSVSCRDRLVEYMLSV